jgi:hypothetical protein
MSWSTFKENLHNFFIKNENAEYRDARRVEGEELKNDEAFAQANLAEAQGDVAKLKRAYLKLAAGERKEAADLFDVFVQIRLIMLRHLQHLQYIKTKVHTAKFKDDAQRAKIEHELHSYIEAIEQLSENIFRTFTSKESANIQAGKLLGIAAQARELANAARIERRAERKTRRVERKAERGKYELLPKLYGPQLKYEIDAIVHAINYGCILLGKLEKDVTTHTAHVHQLITEAGFPKAIGESIYAQFDHAKQFMDERGNLEVKNERILISEAKRAA